MNMIIFDALMTTFSCTHYGTSDGYLQNTLMVKIVNVQVTLVCVLCTLKKIWCLCEMLILYGLTGSH